ncbi:gluconate 2-dehydrogenase subunit 3 family protein [Chitinophaga nivalis]|uniref:Gluconate 2-dehydrogenase subunit 3 family protein n=1 Tax=Chitinophaga nivalis TaxID=2991709 RepID=A0ABT3IVE1_9BACT|nr:gluconate 2-dehydrogenase subunit 3 family protein [Chitinophaga nivalis]MCW3462348.1 gluconate 2-dehydrogenase subunit 3 family protein [Chitinophaga nivalis]MCW3487961.1 gluconate 2-dehydrogenase subunit 3 family protein [Chitinophaga nivalis]
MDRRESLKALALGTLSVGTILSATGCEDKKATGDKKAAGNAPGYGRTPDEVTRDKALMEEHFFTPEEMATITLLADIIIPADDHSCSASEAEVPAFIEFIVKDMPKHQLPMRGGLRWLDVQCAKRYNNSFAGCNATQRMEMVDLIAWPEKAAPEHLQGVAFFNIMRNLTATGFFTSKAGIKDLGYVGNAPNEWDGVPADVLQQYGYAYDEKTLATCLKIEDRGKLMTWE